MSNYFSVSLFIIIALGISPTTFKHVAGESTNQPIVEIIGKATLGKPYIETISISPINPPPGIPLITTPDNTAIKSAIKISLTPVKLLPNIENKNTIFNIEAILEPSICIVAPIGSENLDTSLSIFILSATVILAGKLAKEEQVPKEVIVDNKIFL